MIGDFVVVGDYMGSVEAIGVKSTRLRSIGGEQIVMSNADLLSSRPRNFESVYYVLSSDYGRHMEIKQGHLFRAARGVRARAHRVRLPDAEALALEQQRARGAGTAARTGVHWAQRRPSRIGWRRLTPRRPGLGHVPCNAGSVKLRFLCQSGQPERGSTIVMTEPAIPRPVAELVRDCIHTLDQLEVVRLLHGGEARTWLASEVALALELTEQHAVGALQHLVSQQIVQLAAGSERFLYAPATERLRAQVADLCVCHAEARLDLLLLISRYAMERIRGAQVRTFAQTFLLKKHGDD